MVAFGCGGVLTLIAVILFIKFDIPSLLGELSGRTAEKKVQEIREQNRQAVSMRQRGSERRRKVPLYDAGAEAATGKTSKGMTMPTERKESGGKSERQDEATAVLDEGTAVLDEGTTVLDEGTAVLDEGTAVLDEATTVLAEATTLLSEEIAEEQTTILGEAPVPENADFSMVQDVVEVHTAETI